MASRYGYGYGYQPQQTMIDLIMNRGRIAAEGAQRSGDIWGNTVSGLGQAAGQVIQQVHEQKQVAKRDAGWLDYVNSGEWTKDPKAAYARSLQFWGPEKGPQQFQGLMSTAHFLQGEKRDPKQDREALGNFISAADLFTEEGRAKAYPQMKALVKPLYPDLPVSDQYDPKEWKDVISPLGKQLLGVKPPEPTKLGKDESLVLPSKDRPGAYDTVATGPKSEPKAPASGSLEGYLLGRYGATPTADQVLTGKAAFEAAGRAPREPKAPPEPKWQQGEDENGDPILYDAVSGAVKPFPKGVTPKAGAAEAGRIAGAKAALEASSEIHQYLGRPEVRNAIGPLMGRYNSLAQAAGVGDPVATELVGMLKSYAAMQPNIHGFRAVHFASDIEKLLNTKQTTANLEAALRGIDTAAVNVRDRGRHPAGAARAGGALPVMNSPEDARKLPSGTPFQTPDGRTFTAP